MGCVPTIERSANNPLAGETPTAITATKLTFATVSKFNDTPDDVELTFTVKINGMTVVKKTMLLGTE